MRKIVFAFLGTKFDRPKSEKDRWQTWRPTISLFSDNVNFHIDEFHLFYGSAYKKLAETVLNDIAEISPNTELVREQIE
ncbi:MAG: hypothetical protein LBT05_11260 [Planctomycetaceae bacterium]|jgi:transcriptional regulatory protein RtcR|nr:hypothetical protein [Planctomycetaceae bacterium]